MSHLIIEALNDCLREQNTELKAQLRAAEAVIEAARRECFVQGDGFRRSHVSDDLHRALEAYDKVKLERKGG